MIAGIAYLAIPIILIFVMILMEWNQKVRKESNIIVSHKENMEEWGIHGEDNFVSKPEPSSKLEPFTPRQSTESYKPIRPQPIFKDPVDQYEYEKQHIFIEPLAPINPTICPMCSGSMLKTRYGNRCLKCGFSDATKDFVS